MKNEGVGVTTAIMMPNIKFLPMLCRELAFLERNLMYPFFFFSFVFGTGFIPLLKHDFCIINWSDRRDLCVYYT